MTCCRRHHFSLSCITLTSTPNLKINEGKVLVRAEKDLKLPCAMSELFASVSIATLQGETQLVLKLSERDGLAQMKMTCDHG